MGISFGPALQRATLFFSFVASGEAFSQYPAPVPSPMAPSPASERRRPLALRAWASLGTGCDTAPVFSSKGDIALSRGFLGVHYGAFLPVSVPGGELNVGWEGRHGFGSDQLGLCFSKEGDKSHYPSAFFALHPGLNYRIELGGPQAGYSLKLGAGAAFMVRQLFYTRSALVSRGPEAGVSLDYELKNRWTFRPVINGFFWGMMPLTGVGAASSSEVVFPGEKGTVVAREFSSTGSFTSLRFGGSLGSTLALSGQQTLSILAGFSRSQSTYKEIFTDTYYRGEARTERSEILETKLVDATEIEDFVFLTVRGSPAW